MILYRSFIKKKILLILFVMILMLTKSSKAQQDDFGWRISAGYGYSNYYGDLSNYSISLKNADNVFKLYYLDTKNINLSDLNNSMLNSYSFSIGRRWTRTISFIGQYSHNTISGNDRTDLNGKLRISNPNFSRGLNFKSELNDVSLGLVFRSDNDRFLRSTAFLAPYLSLTAGYTFFDTKADLFDAGGSPYNYLPDGTISGGAIQDKVYETSLRSLMTEGEKYNSNAFNIGLGLGLRFRITSRLGIHAESAMHYAFTDYIDDVSDKYPAVYQSSQQEYASNPTGVTRTNRGNSNTNDVFVYHSLSLSYSFGAPKKREFRVPVFNPNRYLQPIATEPPASLKVAKDTVANDVYTIAPVVEMVAPKVDTDVVSYEPPVEPGKGDSITYKEMNYEIRIIKKDSADNRTNILIKDGRITNISAENSDVFIQDYYKGDNVTQPSIKAVVPASRDDTPGAHKLMIRQHEKSKLIGDTVTIRKIERALNKQDTLNAYLDEQFSDVSSLIARMNHRADSLHRITEVQSEIIASDNKKLLMFDQIVNDTVSSLTLKAGKLERLLAIQPNAVFEQPREGQISDNRTDALNQKYNDNLKMLLRQSQNRPYPDKNSNLDNQESLRRMQEINNLRSQQSSENAQLKQEFVELSRKINESEKAREDALQSYVNERENETKHLQDSVFQLQLKLERMKEQLVKSSEKPKVVSEVVPVVEPFDIKSIPVVEIFFGSGDSRISTNGVEKITQVSSVLSKNENYKVILSGMADATGNREKNIKLSLQRAEAVKDILVNNFSILPDRIKTNALGSATSQGKNALDRKVRIRMVEKF
jgi:outer membrane protein OmpA-like peptidoglycan-associated protein